MVLQAAHEGGRPVGGAVVGSGTVTHGLREPGAEIQTDLVAERDGVPSARFEDHELVRRLPVDEMAGAARAALFLDGADNGEAAGPGRRAEGPGGGRRPPG